MRVYLLIVLIVIAISCNSFTNKDKSKLIGTWTESSSMGTLNYTFNDDGTYFKELIDHKGRSLKESGSFQIEENGIIRLNCGKILIGDNLIQEDEGSIQYLIYDFFTNSSIALTKAKKYTQISGEKDQIVGSKFSNERYNLEFSNENQVYQRTNRTGKIILRTLQLGENNMTMSTEDGPTDDYYFKHIKGNLYMGTITSNFNKISD